jgi:small GTP-binding protein
MNGLSSPFRINIYPNIAYKKHGVPMQLDPSMSVEEFLLACSSKLKKVMQKAFNANGEEITDIAYITCDDDIYLTEGEELRECISNTHFQMSHKQSLDTDFKINLIVLGPAGVGKSSMIVRYIHRQFQDRYIPTVEATFNKVEKVGEETYEVSILDTSGAEEWQTLQYEYMSNKDAIILAYSVDNKDHLSAMEKCYQEIRYYNPHVPIALVANKIDLRKRAISTQEGEALAEKLGGAKYKEVSAKSGKNVVEFFQEVIVLAAKEKKMSIAKERETQYSSNGNGEEEIVEIQQPKRGWTSWLFDKCCLV